MATIRDVAQYAGVSSSAVSRILSNDPTFKVPEETKDLVRRAVADLEYQYVPKKKKQGLIKLGCILAMASAKFKDPFFADIMEAIESECFAQGMRITVRRYYYELEDERVLEEILQEDLSGLILMEQISEEHMERIRSKISNIVSVDALYNFQNINNIGFDHRESNWQVMRHLLRAGYRKIALISGNNPQSSLEDSVRVQVYKAALAEAQIPFDAALVCDCGWDLEVCKSQTKELMNREDRPDAFFAGNDTLASVILGTIYSMGFRCPRDVGVIGFNNDAVSAHLIPPLTTLNIPTHQIGKRAVRRMLEMIKNEDRDVYKIQYNTEIIERASLRKE